MSDDRRLEFEIGVEGTPEEVWRAIATGPGISSWYVPHTIEGREGGHATASFGEGPQMQIAGRVAVWDPPRRIVFDGGEGAGGLSFEWLVEPRPDGGSAVRLVNAGFGAGDEWDAQYDGLKDGWPLFLRNLQLHLSHFRGQDGVSMLPTSMWSAEPDDAWARLLATLGIGGPPAIGQSVRVGGADGPSLDGRVVDAHARWIALLLDGPTPGTAFIAAEGMAQSCGVSVWAYLYGPDATRAASQDLPRWQAWLDARRDG